MLSDIIDSLTKSLRSLVDLAPVKGAVAAGIAFTTSDHYMMVAAFGWLITFDLVTKWMALSYQHMIDDGARSENVGLIQCLADVPCAMHDGYISSSPMKTRFVGKIFLYMVLVFAATKVDVMTRGNGLFVQAAYYYLGATELVSIMENLRDAGVKTLEPLLTFIRSKLGGMK